MLLRAVPRGDSQQPLVESVVELLLSLRFNLSLLKKLMDNNHELNKKYLFKKIIIRRKKHWNIQDIIEISCVKKPPGPF